MCIAYSSRRLDDQVPVSDQTGNSSGPKSPLHKGINRFRDRRHRSFSIQAKGFNANVRESRVVQAFSHSRQLLHVNGTTDEIVQAHAVGRGSRATVKGPGLIGRRAGGPGVEGGWSRIARARPGRGECGFERLCRELEYIT